MQATISPDRRRFPSIFWMRPTWPARRPGTCTRRCTCFTDADHYSEEWTWKQEGKDAHMHSKCSARNKTTSSPQRHRAQRESLVSSVPLWSEFVQPSMAILHCQLISFSAVSPTSELPLFPGDGIGQEVIPQAVKVISASGADVETRVRLGRRALSRRRRHRSSRWLCHAGARL